MNRWRILRIGPTDVYLHPAMLLYGLYALLTEHGLFMVLATSSILLHESAHALTAALFGQPPREIELTPLGAVMRLEDEDRLPPFKRSGMLLAGPGMTLLLAALALHLTKQGILASEAGRLLFMGNLSILLLNLLPALPLDGGRLLSLLLGLFWPSGAVTRVMRLVGSLLGIGLIGMNIYASSRLGGWNLSLAFAGCCLLYCAGAATTTQAMAEIRRFMDRKIRMERKGTLPIQPIAVLHTQTLRMLVRRLPPNRMSHYAILEAGTMNFLGELTELQIIGAYLQHPECSCGKLLGQVKNPRDNERKNSNI